MYCLKCRRITETENITTAVSKNSRLMRRGQIVEKLRLNLLKKEPLGKFSKFFSEQTPLRNAFTRS